MNSLFLASMVFKSYHNSKPRPFSFAKVLSSALILSTWSGVSTFAFSRTSVAISLLRICLPIYYSVCDYCTSKYSILYYCKNQSCCKSNTSGLMQNQKLLSSSMRSLYIPLSFLVKINTSTFRTQSLSEVCLPFSGSHKRSYLPLQNYNPPIQTVRRIWFRQGFLLFPLNQPE